MSIDLSIVSVNYGDGLQSIESLERTLAAIKLTSLSYEIVLVDNPDPTGHSAAVTKWAEQRHDVFVLRAPSNGGFGYGCNLGCDLARGRVIWLLNSDAWVVDACGLGEILAKLEDRSIGFIATYVALTNGLIPPQKGGYLSFTYVALQTMRLGRLYRSLPTVLQKALEAGIRCTSIGERYVSHENANAEVAIFFESQMLGGASLLVSKENYLLLGGFDERFFLYDEDGDITLRATKKGLKNLITNHVTVLTPGSVTTSKLSPLFLKRIKRDSRLLFVRKHFTGVSLVCLEMLTKVFWRTF